jgi:GAF domain-containing protein
VDVSSRRKALRRSKLERNLERLRTSGKLRSVSGRVRTATPPPAQDEDSDPFAALQPGDGGGARIAELQQEIANLKRLQEVIHFLGGAPDLVTLQTELLDLAVSLSGLSRGMLALAAPSDDEGSRRFKVKAKRGFEDPKVKASPEAKVLRNILNHCLESRESLLEGNIRNAEDGGILGHASGKRLRLGAVACLPLQAGGRMLGAVVLDDPERRAPFTPAEQHLLRSFARHSAVALARVAHQNRLKRQAALLQRRNDRLEGQLEQAARRMHKVERTSERLRAHVARPNTAGQELRRMLRLDYADAKQQFTRRYLSEVMDAARGDLRRAAEATGLPLARLIGLLDHLGLGGHPPARDR